MEHRALSAISLTSILRPLASILSDFSTDHVGFIVLSKECAVWPHRASEGNQGSPYIAGVVGGRLWRGFYHSALISGTAVTNKVRRVRSTGLDAPTTPLSHLYP